MRFLIFIVTFVFTSNLQSQIKIDSLIIKKNQIEKIEFLTDGYESGPDFDLIIYSDKTVIFNARSDNFKERVTGEVVGYGVGSDGIDIRKSEVKGIFKTKIENKTYNEIIDLIKPLKNEFIEKTYLSNYFHNSVGILKINFKNGDTKMIYDGRLGGTEKLLILYEYFYELRFNQKWE